MIVVLDFGSQYTQLIARKIRELGVYCEIHPYNISVKKIEEKNPCGIILSGGPQSVLSEGSPICDKSIFEMGLPILGICYGMQLITKIFGGVLKSKEQREYGLKFIKVERNSDFLSGIPEINKVWMSHGDHIEKPPEGFEITATSGEIVAVMENSSKNIFATQFHPEVHHTENGIEILKNFLFKIAKCKRDWDYTSFLKKKIEDISNKIKNEKAICALSGGVDSTVAAVIVHRAIGENLKCIFVNNGLLRKKEFEKVLERLKSLKLNVKGIDASEKFLKDLKGITDPEEKRKIIGRDFIEVFEREAGKMEGVKFLVQGTLYPDVIESVSVVGPSVTIKSHHNVGGLPEKMNLKLIEPLRDLFKDEVRKIGKELGIPDSFLNRQPFPGPGLGIRIIGEITEERLEILRKADDILIDEVKKAGLYEKIWQSFAILLPIKSVGVMGDERSYENVIAIRAVDSVDGMTADWVKLDYELLAKISSRIVNEVKGVNRVVYDISTKPPATIEWE